jgi:hypothetical protein
MVVPLRVARAKAENVRQRLEEGLGLILKLQQMVENPSPQSSTIKILPNLLVSLIWPPACEHIEMTP